MGKNCLILAGRAPGHPTCRGEFSELRAVARLLYLPGGGHRRVGTLAHQIAAIVRQTSPDVLCFACLAARHGQPEHDVRAVSLILVARHGLELARRPCSACAREDEVLIAQKAA